MIRALLFILLLCFSLPALASDMPMQNFERIPVQHEGRIKPLDTFARVMLKTLSGKEDFQDMSASEWLAETLFNPLGASEQPVFHIPNADVRHRLGVPERQNALYSYAELVPGLGKTFDSVGALLKKQPGSLSADEKALLGIHDNALLYTQLLRTLSLILPLNVELPGDWAKKIGKKAGEDLSYLDLRKIERDAQEATKKIISRKGENIESYTNEEKQVALLSYQLALLGDAASRNQLVRIIPVVWSDAAGEWQSPWAILQGGQGSPDTGAILQTWKDLASAWNSRDAARWLHETQQAYQMPLYMGGQASDFWRLDLEVAYNTFSPFELGTAIYAIGLLLSLGFLISDRKALRRLSYAVILSGIVIQFVGLIARIVILQRPPVSTLYESMIFVTLVCAAIGVFFEARLRNGMGLLTSSLAGLFLGLMAISFNATEDSLRMLSAVLNTNFWLATHVLCITFGYGWCVIVSVLAHFSLARKVLHPNEQNDLSGILSLSMLMAILFTATGTILGGIWADQSWGRFWGWDPKENGALLIVLWLVWLMHGKLSGHLTPNLLLTGQAFLAVIVGAAWLGVNLLGVGLHSYGFAEGLFWGLGLFTLTEIAFISGLCYLIMQHAKKSH